MSESAKDQNAKAKRISVDPLVCHGQACVNGIGDESNERSMLDQETSFLAMWTRGDFEFCKNRFGITLGSVDLATHCRSFRSVLKSPSHG